MIKLLTVLFCCVMIIQPDLGQDKEKNNAVTTSFKNTYKPAVWLSDFDNYIIDPLVINSLNEASVGYQQINLKSYCLHPGKPDGSKTGGFGFLMAPLKGKKAGLIKEILNRYSSHPEILQFDVQILIWGIVTGVAYKDYPEDYRKKIDPLLPDSEKKGNGIDLDDLTGLIPDELKEQLGVFNNIKDLIKSGISNYEELERIAVPETEPVPSGKDIVVAPNQWTLFENGYYFRTPFISHNFCTVDIYKPEQVELIYDSKDRIISLQNISGKIDIVYDDNAGADIIEIGGKNFNINRISQILLNGKEMQCYKNAMWTLPYNNNTTLSSSYKPEHDPVEQTFNERNKLVNSFIEKLKVFNSNKKIKINETDVRKLYDLRQLELCLKNSFDFAVMIDISDKRITGKMVTDATLNKISDVSFSYKLTSGALRGAGLNMDVMVLVAGAEGMQRIGISGTGNNEGGDPNGNPPPNEHESDPPETHEEKDCPDVVIKQVPQSILPEPGQNITITIENNSTENIEEIVYEVSDISKENGRCINDKDPSFYMSSPESDVTIEGANNPSMTIDGGSSSDHITATGPGSIATIILTIKDFAAYCKIQARVKINGKWCYARAEITGASNISFPYDLNNNKVADSWEEEFDVAGFHVEYDEDSYPSGNAVNGDGMTLFEEYRGVYIIDPGTTNVRHIRTDPKKKEIFVIDESNVVPFQQWWGASEITAYRLGEEQVYGRLGGTPDDQSYKHVNFSSTSSPGVKYAVNVIRILGLGNPYTLGETSRRGETYYIGPPINIIRTVIFPDRIHNMLRTEIPLIAQYLRDNPVTDPVHYGLYDFPRSLMQRVADMVSDLALYNEFYQFLMDNTVIHELGHACKIEHHGHDISPGATYEGDPQCPMKYSDVMQFARTFFSVTLPSSYWRFCTTPDNCRGQINVNDRTP